MCVSGNGESTDEKSSKVGTLCFFLTWVLSEALFELIEMVDNRVSSVEFWPQGDSSILVVDGNTKIDV